MPAIENMKTASASAIMGWVLASPRRSSMPSSRRPFCRIERMQAKVPTVMTR